MNKAKCTFCANDKSAEFWCSKCKGRFPVCTDCAARESPVCASCSAVKCFRCDASLTASAEGAFVKTAFQDCKTSSHFCVECRDCWLKTQNRLLSTADERFCFICLEDLKGQGILYFNETLSCPQRHKTAFCGPCHALFQQVEINCPACVPLTPGKPRCVICLREGSTGIFILPFACLNTRHKLQVCLECSTRIGGRTFPCRYCANKPQKNVVHFTRLTGANEASSLLCVRFISNQLRREKLAVDPVCCPECDALAVQPWLLPITHGLNDSDAEVFLPGAAAAGAGSTAVVTGGFSPAAESSSAGSWLVTFQRDGRFFEYGIAPLPAMHKKRHAHALFHHAELRQWWVLGGVCKDNMEKIEYLDSVESLALDPAAAEGGQPAAWEKAAWKLAKPRGFFSVLFRNGKLYLFGGIGAEGKSLRCIEVVDFARGASAEVVFKNSELLPSLQPSIIPQDAGRVLLFGGGKETTRQQVLVYDFERGTLGVKTDVRLPFTGYSRPIATNVFGSLLVLSGTKFGVCSNPPENGDHFQFWMLGSGNTPTVVNRRLDNYLQDVFQHAAHQLYAYLPVEFGA